METTCCDFVCLDDRIGGQLKLCDIDIGLRPVLTIFVVFIVILSISLLFCLIISLRQRKKKQKRRNQKKEPEIDQSTTQLTAA